MKRHMYFVRPHVIGGVGGAVLLVCLLLLVSLTFLGIAAAWDHILQDRMHGNLQQNERAGHSANLALSFGEDWLMSLPGDQRPVSCLSDCVSSQVIRAQGGYPSQPQVQDSQWWESNGHTAGFNPADRRIVDAGLSETSPPSYWIIEELADHPEPDLASGVTETAYYRIWARGATPDSRGFAVTQSIVSRPWGIPGHFDEFPDEPSTPGFCYRADVLSPCGRQAWQRVH